MHLRTFGPTETTLLVSMCLAAPLVASAASIPASAVDAKTIVNANAHPGEWMAPAPLNLPIPPYFYKSEKVVVVGKLSDGTESNSTPSTW